MAATAGKVLMLMESRPGCRDGRLRNESEALIKAGYQVSVISPRPPARHSLCGARRPSPVSVPAAAGGQRSVWFSIGIHLRPDRHVRSDSSGVGARGF